MYRYSYGELNCDRLHILITFIYIITPLLTFTNKPVLARAPSNIARSLSSIIRWFAYNGHHHFTSCPHAHRLLFVFLYRVRVLRHVCFAETIFGNNGVETFLYCQLEGAVGDETVTLARQQSTDMFFLVR